jgi:hypothetical protein
MKKPGTVITAVLTMTAFASVCWADDHREAKPRFKGVELYSWKDKSGDWVFVLLSGTNNEKQTEKVKAAKNQLKGTEEMKKALARLAVGEQVSWTHRIEGFEFPPEGMRKEIKKAAAAAKVKLRISDERE